MLRTITLCSGKGGVGKTLLATSLARVIKREEGCNVLLVDLDVSVRGLTLLAFQNKYALDQVPVSLIDYLSAESTGEPGLFAELRKSIPVNGEAETQPSLYQRLEKVFILPSSTENELPDWTQLGRIEFDQAVAKLGQLQAFARESLNVGYLIFDTQAGLGSLSLAAAILSDINLIVLEEDDISWRTALLMFLEIADLNKRWQKRSKSYFLVNKVNSGLLEVEGKLKAFSFLPPLPYDAWMQKRFAQATVTVLEREFESSDFFRQVHSRLWKELAHILDVARQPTKSGSSLLSWWRT